MARIAFAANFAALSLLLSGCGRGDDQHWGGFVLGQPAPMGAYDPVPNAVVADHIPPPHGLYLKHAVMMDNAPEFPWQEAFAQVDRQGRVVAIILSIACCTEQPESYAAPSPDIIRVWAAAERKVPDRFEENVRPTRYRYNKAFEDSTRFISAHDMTAYSQAALRQAIARLGPPTTRTIGRRDGMAFSYLDDGKVLRLHWLRMGPSGPKDFAILDVGTAQSCLTIAAAGGRQLPIRSGCGGLDLGCYDEFYPAIAPRGQTRSDAMPEDDYCRKL